MLNKFPICLSMFARISKQTKANFLNFSKTNVYVCNYVSYCLLLLGSLSILFSTFIFWGVTRNLDHICSQILRWKVNGSSSYMFFILFIIRRCKTISDLDTKCFPLKSESRLIFKSVMWEYWFFFWQQCESIDCYWVIRETISHLITKQIRMDKKRYIRFNGMFQEFFCHFLAPFVKKKNWSLV